MTATPSPRMFSLCNCGTRMAPGLSRRDLLAGELKAVDRDNALRLVPRLSAA